MAAYFSLVLGQVGTLFLLMSVGYLLGRRGMITEVGAGQLSSLLVYVSIPSVIINALQIDPTPRNLHIIYWGLLLNLGYYLLLCPLMQLLFRRQEEKTRSVLRFGGIYGNVGFMGLPLIQAVVGQEGVLLCVLGIVVFNLVQWTHGVAVMGGGLSLRRALINPATVPLSVALTLFAFSLRLPGPVGSAVSFFAGLNTPLAMLVIGVQMSHADLKRTVTTPLLYSGAAVKLVLVPAVTALLLLPLGLEPLLYTVFVILSATPSGGSAAILAQLFDRDTASAAQLITLTTLLSAVTLPLFAVLARYLAG